MSALDIISIPGHPGMYARRAFVEAWQAAGSPPINSAGRLYDKQKYFWDGWANRLPGFNPADNPDDERQPLAHVRFVAGDIDPTPERIRRLAAAGLIRPYKYEPWHWELPNVRSYAIVRSIPTPADSTPAPNQSEEDDMLALLIDGVHKCTLGPAVFSHMIKADNPDRIKDIVTADDRWTPTTLTELPVLLARHGVDLHIWDVRNGKFVVLNPLDGSVREGNTWSAWNAIRSTLAREKVTSAATAAYVAAHS